MDMQTDTRPADQIARDLDAAVTEHERVATEVRTSYASLLDATIDLLAKTLDRTASRAASSMTAPYL